MSLRAMGLSALVLGAGSADARSFEEITKSGELRVCAAPGLPVTPSGCKTDCQYKGPDRIMVETAQAFATSLGKVKARVRLIVWDEQFHDKSGSTKTGETYTPKLLEDGTCDVYTNNLTVVDWREKMMDFVDIYSGKMMVIINKSRKKDFRDIADLQGLNAVVEKHTTYHLWIEAANKNELKAKPAKIQFVSGADAVALVDAGKADFTLLDADAAFWFTRVEAKNSHGAFAVGSLGRIGWGIAKENKKLFEAMKSFIEASRADKASVFQRVWLEELGIPLGDFEKLMESSR